MKHAVAALLFLASTASRASECGSLTGPGAGSASRAATEECVEHLEHENAQLSVALVRLEARVEKLERDLALAEIHRVARELDAQK
jgi:hypothetical protein